MRYTHVTSAFPLTASDLGAYRLDIAVESFDAYYERSRRRLVGFAYVLTGSHWIAEDLVQETFVEAHRKWSDICRYDQPEAWLRRVLINKSRSRFRKLRTEAKTLNTVGSLPPGISQPCERTMEVWDAVRQLPARQAQCIALLYWEDYSRDQIAAVLGVSTETVKTHLSRARETLARQLSCFGPEL